MSIYMDFFLRSSKSSGAGTVLTVAVSPRSFHILEIYKKDSEFLRDY